MKNLTVKTETHMYDVVIGYNVIEKLGQYLKKLKLTESIFIITSKSVYKLYGEKIYSILEKSGIKDVGFEVLPDGEISKSWKNYEKIISGLIDFDRGKEKDICIICLGGGVIGDIGGFAASTYRRGIPYIQIPTTLLACVDSSVGGKTAIDFKRRNRIVKNIVGQFYQPSLVFIDLSFLKSLPEKEILNGIAEVIKYGIIVDRNLFEYLESNIDNVVELKPSPLKHIVTMSCDIKRRIVQQDEKETGGIRTILNYGHTIGHAIEGASGFKYTHGEAISIGMVCEAEISYRLGLINKTNLSRIEDLIARSGLPTTINTGRVKIEDTLRVMRYDKKFRHGMNRFVLPIKIGNTFIKTGINESLILQVLRKRIK